MSIIELPIIYQADAAARRRRHDRIWLHDNQTYTVEETSARRHQLLCQYTVPRSNLELEWRLIDGMIMRPLVYELQLHYQHGDLYLDTLGPDDDIEMAPFRDHPSFSAALTNVWPQPESPTAAAPDDEERHRDFRFWRWDNRDERDRKMRRDLLNYRLDGNLLWKEATLPSWVVSIRAKRVALSLSHVDASASYRVEGFHFNLEHRDAAYAFASWLSNQRYEPPDFHPPISSVAQAVDASDLGTGYSVARFLSDEIGNRAAWRLSPALSAVYSEFRLAYQREGGHSFTHALAMLEALTEIDLVTAPLRRLVRRLKERQNLIAQCVKL